jgi:hypothetical protein
MLCALADHKFINNSYRISKTLTSVLKVGTPYLYRTLFQAYQLRIVIACSMGANISKNIDF